MKALLFLTVMTVVATIALGVHIYRNGHINGMKSVKAHLFGNLAVFVPLMMAAFAIMIPDVAHAAGAEGLSSGQGMACIGAALATGLACIGAGAAVGPVGSSAIGAISEDPKLLGKTLIFVGLGEGIAIYGIIISIMIFGRM